MSPDNINHDPAQNSRHNIRYRCGRCRRRCRRSDNHLPTRVTQPTPEKVVAEHLAAFNACDWKRLMAQFPDNVEFFAPNGEVVRGRESLGEMFAKVVKPPAQGGVCGLKITAEHTFMVGDVVNVQWRADAPFLAEPYRGADAYETKDGLMAAQVTTFDATALKMKK